MVSKMFTSNKNQYLDKVISNLLVQRELSCEYLDYVCAIQKTGASLLVNNAIAKIADIDRRIVELKGLKVS